MKYRVYTVILVSFLIFNSKINYAQLHYHSGYDGIPIMGVYTNVEADSINSAMYSSMKDLGIMGIMTRVNSTIYNEVTGKGFKIIPLNRHTNDNWLSYYSEGVYSKWEAEGVEDSSNGALRVLYNSDAAEVFTDGDVSGIVTKDFNRNIILYGPGYYQDVQYRYLENPGSENRIIEYSADYKLKIKKLSGYTGGNLTQPVCTLQVTAANPYIQTPGYKEYGYI